MEKDNLTEEAQVGSSQLNESTGDEAVNSAISLTLEEINSLTGKDYKDKDTALKSIVDMSKQAGKASDLEGRLREYEQSKSEPTASKPSEEVETLRKEVETMKTESFFAQNPNHAENRELLEALAYKHNVSLQEATDLPAYKGVMDKLETATERRTTLASNNRVAAPKEESPVDQAVNSGDPMAMAKAVTDAFLNK